MWEPILQVITVVTFAGAVIGGVLLARSKYTDAVIERLESLVAALEATVEQKDQEIAQLEAKLARWDAEAEARIAKATAAVLRPLIERLGNGNQT